MSSSFDEIRNARLAKLELLQKAGMDAFPIESDKDFDLRDIRADFEKLAPKGPVSAAGRIMAIRGQGAIMFAPLFDGTDTFQAVFKKDNIEANHFKLFTDAVDIGDIISVTGLLELTQKGEKSLFVKSWKMLAKSLRPLPEKWNGLQDVEERFRRRYLDTVMSGEVRERFNVRSKTITALRAILDKDSYMEVETPQLQPLAGGTNAAPFSTHHNALDIDLYLRIAPELYLKKLLIGGFPRVYEIGRNFRNEGIDVTHNPEFTMLEFYAAFSTAKEQMKFVEKMFKALVKKVLGTTVIKSGEGSIDLAPKFARISYKNLLKEHAGINPEVASIEAVREAATKHGVKFDMADSREKVIDNVYKKTCRPKLVNPTFVFDYPINMLPLAKRSEKNDKVVDAFQLIIGGMELVKAFSELNDPIDQKKRFDKEEENAKAGDSEAQPNDLEYVEALEYGCPPAGGVGIGIDRLVMLLTDTRNIKEVIFFPTMKPRE